MAMNGDTEMYAASTQVLISSITDLQRTAEYSDFTIFCGNDIHRVHKAVVCPRAPFFAGACRVGREALKNEVTLPDDEPKLVRLMIDYLYQLDYNDTSGPQDGHAPTGEIDERASSLIPEPVSPVAQAIIDFEELSAPAAPTAEEVGDVDFAPFRKGKKGKRKKPASLAWDDEPAPPVDFEPKESELSIHAHMYELAEKYGIHDLKDLARTKFAESVSEKWNGSEFPLAIRIVYATTPENDNGLRDVVVETISQHKELLSEGSVEEVVKDINGLAFALLKSAWAY